MSSKISKQQVVRNARRVCSGFPFNSFDHFGIFIDGLSVAHFLFRQSKSLMLARSNGFRTTQSAVPMDGSLHRMFSFISDLTDPRLDVEQQFACPIGRGQRLGHHPAPTDSHPARSRTEHGQQQLARTVVLIGWNVSHRPLTVAVGTGERVGSFNGH